MSSLSTAALDSAEGEIRTRDLYLPKPTQTVAPWMVLLVFSADINMGIITFYAQLVSGGSRLVFFLGGG